MGNSLGRSLNRRTRMLARLGALSAVVLLAAFGLASRSFAEPTSRRPPPRVEVENVPADVPDGGVLLYRAPARKRHGPPDPTPLRSKKHWLYDLQWNRGHVALLAVGVRELEHPRKTPRVVGRFAIELYDGKRLVERVRFDFPMLRDGDLPDVKKRWSTSFDRNLRTRVGVLFPETAQGDKLELVDRARGTRYILPWHPEGVRDAGAPISASELGPDASRERK